MYFEIKNVYSDRNSTMRAVSDKNFSPGQFLETRLLFLASGVRLV